MPKRESIDDLKDRIDELESENEALQDQIDSITDIVTGEDEEEGNGKEHILRGKHEAMPKPGQGGAVSNFTCSTVAQYRVANWTSTKEEKDRDDSV